jgi:hypothetical protein
MGKNKWNAHSRYKQHPALDVTLKQSISGFQDGEDSYYGLLSYDIGHSGN